MMPRPAAPCALAAGPCDHRRVNWLDVVALALVCTGLVLGVRSGAVPQVLGLLGLLGGAVLVLALAPLARTVLAGVDQPARALLAIAGVLGVVGTCEAIGSGFGRSIRARYVGGLGAMLDGILGGVAGVAQAIVIIWIVGGLIAAAPVPTVAQEAQRSQAIRTLSGILPPPGTLTGQVARIVGESGLPELFLGLEPAPAAPVGLPSDATARAIGEPVAPSVMRVESEACGRILTGTGFAVAPGYVVTNAHVIAGSGRIQVTADATGMGRPRDAVAVLFDPTLDVALLRVPGLRSQGLAFAAAMPERGAPAAALGHPEGGRLTIIPAAVTATYRAAGRDLYGDRTVDRQIVEIRGEIQPGDSGGPLVLADGTVGGVVFAESRSDPSVGYALAVDAVSATVIPAVGRSGAVATGPCT